MYMKAFSRVQLITRADLAYQVYSTNEFRNGIAINLAQSARFFFVDPFTGMKHSLSVGGRLNTAFSKDEKYNRNAWELTGSLNFKLPYNFTFSPNMRYSQSFYVAPATALEINNRVDKIFAVGANLEYTVSRVFSVSLVYRYTNNVSTSNLYTYDQHYTSFGGVYRF